MDGRPTQKDSMRPRKSDHATGHGNAGVSTEV